MNKPGTSISAKDSVRLRNGRALMTIGCLGSLLSFGLCASGTFASGTLFLVAFYLPLLLGLIGVTIYSSVSSAAVRRSRSLKLVNRHGFNVLSIIERFGGKIDIGSLLNASGMVPKELKSILDILVERNQVARHIDPQGVQWITLMTAAPEDDAAAPGGDPS